jgi:hypothetical protein
MKINVKSKKVIAGGLAASVLTGGGAYAYWTGGGGGTGAAGTASGTMALTVSQTALTPMTPGMAAQTLSGTFGNTNTAPVYVATVTASITSVTGGAGACSLSNYSLLEPEMTVGAEVPVGTLGTWGGVADGATIQMLDTGVNQDGCKGATVNLTYVIA